MRGISRRPISVAFRDFQDTVLIMDKARLLRGKQYGLDRDYAAEISYSYGIDIRSLKVLRRMLHWNIQHGL